MHVRVCRHKSLGCLRWSMYIIHWGKCMYDKAAVIVPEHTLFAVNMRSYLILHVRLEPKEITINWYGASVVINIQCCLNDLHTIFLHALLNPNVLFACFKYISYRMQIPIPGSRRNLLTFRFNKCNHPLCGQWWAKCITQLVLPLFPQCLTLWLEGDDSCMLQTKYENFDFQLAINKLWENFFYRFRDGIGLMEWHGTTFWSLRH